MPSPEELAREKMGAYLVSLTAFGGRLWPLTEELNLTSAA